MIDVMSQTPPHGSTRVPLLRPRLAAADDEAIAARLLRPASNSAHEQTDGPSAEVRLRRVAADILRSVQSRLPGRIRDLKVRFVEDHFVISGVSSSYYVKQVAQHVAMTALEALMLGRLVNEIEVRSVR